VTPHLPVLPVVLPLLAGCVLLLSGSWSARARTVFALLATAALLPVSVQMIGAVAHGGHLVYALGNWAPPFGIVLVADRLSALMVLLTSVVAIASLLYATSRDRSAVDPKYLALFQLQLLGINGAFLTGDLFNLFVFFEVLLIASYALLLHGFGPQRVVAAVHVVVLNLLGSALFLFAVGLIYGVAGTLNFADLARVLPELPAADAPLARSGALLLLVVFALKAAVLPLGFWLPRAYAAAMAANAALFAVLTKVGVYAILRIYPLLFGSDAGEVADVAAPWVLPGALATLAFGALGVLAARTLRAGAGWLVVYSVGTLLVAVGLFNEAGYAAAIYYTAHSTLASAALFLVVDLVASQRTYAGDRLDLADDMPRAGLLAALFFFVAVTMAGLPPLTGFAGKIMILEASRALPGVAMVWTIVLGSTLLVIVALARAGSAVFWRTGAATGPVAVRPGAGALTAVLAVAGSIAALVAWGGAATEYALGTARELADPSVYVNGVLGADAPVGDAHRRSLR
jgi:multicomponent K+:H+ antiporter subunit D